MASGYTPGIAGGSLAQLLAQMYGQRRPAMPSSFGELPEDERRRANALSIVQLGSAIGGARPGEWGSALAEGATAHQLIRERALEENRRRAQEAEQQRRGDLEGQLRVAQMQQEVQTEEAERERWRGRRGVAEREAAARGIDLGDTSFLTDQEVVSRFGETLKANQAKAEETATREAMADRVSAAAEARGGDPKVARELVLAGATPNQALEQSLPEKGGGAGALTPYQQFQIGRYESEELEEDEERREAEAERAREEEATEREIAAIGATLRANGITPTGVLTVDKPRYDAIIRANPKARNDRDFTGAQAVLDRYRDAQEAGAGDTMPPGPAGPAPPRPAPIGPVSSHRSPAPAPRPAPRPSPTASPFRGGTPTPAPATNRSAGMPQSLRALIGDSPEDLRLAAMMKNDGHSWADIERDLAALRDAGRR